MGSIAEHTASCMCSRPQGCACGRGCALDDLFLIHTRCARRLQVTCRKLLPDILGRASFTLRSFLPLP